MAKVLIIEDEKSLARFIELELQHENYETHVELDGRSGLEQALENDWDVILLDLMLPNLNGIEVERRIRQKKDTPIIIMTARDSVMDRVSGLDHGADDYIVKPFAIEELLARIRAVLRRTADSDDDSVVDKDQILKFKDLTLEKDTRVVRRGKEVLKLTQKEFDLLKTLMEHQGEVLSRKYLMDVIWSHEDSDTIATNILEVYIKYLRNKIDKPNESSYIKTVRGKGYTMNDEK